MVDPLINWLNGFSALILVISAWISGIFNLRRYIERKTNSHLYMTILAFAIAIGWTGITLSFLSVAFYGYNYPGLKNIISYFSFSTIPIGSFAVVNISWDLLFSPEKRKYGVSLFIILYAIYYFFLYFTWNATVIIPDVPPGGIFDDWLSSFSIPYWMIWAIVGLSALLWAIGINNFRQKSTGELRKRGYNLLFSTFFVGGAILLDVVIFMAPQAELLWIPRLMMIPGLYLGYIGLRPV
ncbi:MAG: hypothetical protein ACTSRS_00870 [Candidatus Helarchaeota archaeon]